MKRTSLFSIVVVFGLLVSISANATGVSTEFKHYEITPVDDLYLGKKVEKVWTLTYSGDQRPVTVIKTRNIEGTNYIVRSEFFEVNYLSGSEGFGVVELKKHWSNIPKQITNAVINQKEMQNQRIITPTRVDDEKALGLIAGFLPLLLNEGYTHLLN